MQRHDDVQHGQPDVDAVAHHLPVAGLLPQLADGGPNRRQTQDERACDRVRRGIRRKEDDEQPPAVTGGPSPASTPPIP